MSLPAAPPCSATDLSPPGPAAIHRAEAKAAPELPQQAAPRLRNNVVRFADGIKTPPSPPRRAAALFGGSGSRDITSGAQEPNTIMVRKRPPSIPLDMLRRYRPVRAEAIAAINEVTSLSADSFSQLEDADCGFDFSDFGARSLSTRATYAGSSDGTDTRLGDMYAMPGPSGGGAAFLTTNSNCAGT